MRIQEYLLIALAAMTLVFSAPAQSTNRWEYNVRNYGAKGDGRTDDSVAISNCVSAAINTKGNGAGPVMVEVIFPPGNYLVTKNDTLMTPGNGTNNEIYGLTIGGFGKDVSHVIFSPINTSKTNPSVGNLFSAHNRTRWLHIEDMSFESRNNVACCFYFRGDGSGGQNEGCVFERLAFSGNWQRVFGFDGDSTANLNSEMTFRNISGGTATYSDAFFRAGGISGTFNQQNQFVDYWFYDSNFILNEGTLFKFDKCGAANFINGSWSAASSSSPAMTFISMPTNNYNNMSAAQFRFCNIRFEPKASNHRIIDCNLNMASILFESCVDLGSIQNANSYAYPLRRYTGGSPWGFGIQPTVRYVNCHLAGYDLYEGPAAARGKFIYEGCYFYRGQNGNMANATQDQGSTATLQWSSGSPRYTFRNCWNINDVKNIGLLAPDAPGSLIAKSGDSQVSLNWSASAGATSYIVKKAMINKDSYSTISTVGGTNFVDLDVINGTMYYYVVSAVNAQGESGNSIMVSVRPSSIASPLLTTHVADGSQIRLDWPYDHTGWQLEVQTNSIFIGLSTNWTVISNSLTTNQITLPVNPVNGSIFFRLANQ